MGNAVVMFTADSLVEFTSDGNKIPLLFSIVRAWTPKSKWVKNKFLLLQVGSEKNDPKPCSAVCRVMESLSARKESPALRSEECGGY